MKTIEFWTNRFKVCIRAEKRATLCQGFTSMTTRSSMNFDWRYRGSDDSRFAAVGFDDRDWQVVDIPHTMHELPMQYFRMDRVTGVGWYRKDIPVGELEEGTSLALRFEGVATRCTLWCDGIPIGSHEGAYTPFEIPLPARVMGKKTVLIALRCDATEDPEVPPFGHVVDFIVPGGIYREVSLVHRPRHAIEDLYVRSRLIGEEREVSVDCRFTQSCCRAQQLALALRIVDPEGHLLATCRQELSDAAMTVHLVLRNVRLWDIAEPVLHRVIATLTNEGTVCDEMEVRTGFRDILFTRSGFFLNGRAVKLRGLNRHQLYPYVGQAMPKSQQAADADFLKRLGVQVVRTSHYPQSSHFLDRCDELGLLVVTELPGWQHIGRSARWKDSAMWQLRELVIRDRNHPSVILWGVRINESADDDEFYRKTNELARWLDPSRPTGGVRNFARSHLIEDVYTYNDFSHDGTRPALAPPSKIVGNGSAPYLVTEHTGHMYPARAGDPEMVRTEHALRHARVLDAMYADERISGAIGWCMSDYQTHRDFGGGDGICHHGVADMFRNPKMAAYVYESQQDEHPVMHVSSCMHIGSRPAHAPDTVWVFTNCDRVQLSYCGQPVGMFEPDRKRFAHLVHPPIAIDDLIGSRLDELEGFHDRERTLLREALRLAATSGFDLPLRIKLGVGLLMRRHRLRPSDAVSLFERFVLAWDDRPSVWEFTGYTGDAQVARQVFRPADTVHLEIACDRDSMHQGETYDVVRCALSLCSESGVLAWMSHAPVRIETSGPVRLIGPDVISLEGGMGGCYLRTIGMSGIATVSVSSPHAEGATCTIAVD